MFNEIGSEYSYVELYKTQGLQLPDVVEDYTFTFSGRTSIETVLKNELNIKKVMLPSYCCDSMIEPFRHHNIIVDFYEVNYYNSLNIRITISEDVDAIVWCDYFGYKSEMPDFTSFRKRGGVIIEDITQSFYSDAKYNQQSDYLVASLRKWEPVLSGGYCASLKKKLDYKPFILPSDEYLKIKRYAMRLKNEYLEENKEINKNDFLEKFIQSNRWLSRNYSGLSIDQESLYILCNIDYFENVRRRRENAKELYKGLCECKLVRPLFEEEKMDCPLFVPVLVKDNRRNALREFLIEKNIFCPIHWPKPSSECNSNLYDKELSLICDQRYSREDMKKIIRVIKEYEKGIIYKGESGSEQ